MKIRTIALSALFILMMGISLIPGGRAAEVEDQGTIVINVYDENGDEFAGNWYLHQGINERGMVVRNGSNGETFLFSDGTYYLRAHGKTDAPYPLIHSDNPQALEIGETITYNVQYFATEEALLAATGPLAWQSYRASYVLGADPRNPYVYAHTLPDIVRLSDDVEQLAHAAPEGHRTVIAVIWQDAYYWPLPWYLRRFDHVGYWTHVPDAPAAASRPPRLVRQSAHRAAAAAAGRAARGVCRGSERSARARAGWGLGASRLEARLIPPEIPKPVRRLRRAGSS